MMHKTHNKIKQKIIYDLCYTLHPDIKFVVNLDGKVWRYLSVILLNTLKTKNKLHFITLNYTFDYTLYSKL